jgi:membrane-bound serine protease (ClpP class)
MNISIFMQNISTMKAFKVLLQLSLVLAVITININTVYAQKAKVMVMDIKNDIDPRMSRYVKLALEHAEKIEADYVIIEMDTYGGIVTDAKDIVESLLDFKKPIWVFINKDAASAGALISIACDSIYMTPGATIGAATVVGADGSAAPDKYQSYMRSIMRSTAEEKGRDPKIAEAMVDQSIAIDSVTKEGQVITFSVSEAIKYGFCEAKVNSIEEILERNQVTDYSIEKYELSAAEKIIAFFLNPFISGILILVIIGGIWFELQTPGVGFPILASGIALVFYFVPYYLNGLAQNWEIILFFVGIGLLLVEAFVIPGFGIAGILGIICVVGSLSLMMLNNDVFDFDLVLPTEIFVAVGTTLSGILGSILLLFFAGVRFSNSKLFSRIALTDTMQSTEGYTGRFVEQPMAGKKGLAYTVLRPSGKVLIEGEIYDAYTRGDFIDKGEEILVLDDEGTSLRVKVLK